MPEGAETGGPVETVRRLLAALGEGRAEDVAALVHPEVVWQPVTRPGRSVYVGGEGTLTFMADLRAAMGGDFGVEVEALRQQPDGAVIVVGRLAPVAGEVGPRTESVFTLRDGLVCGVESRPAPEDDETP